MPDPDIDHVARLMLKAWTLGLYGLDITSQEALKALRELHHGSSDIDEQVYVRMTEIREQEYDPYDPKEEPCTITGEKRS